ncbi:hypothetical protein ITJ64_07815 [Herbiconiux sp. VKM Ac-1786]|uniref:hypothetical protein n=1 Tax=Herbiconiux sp. VKM Ac-1786 TaxID=2783824 RepID=UPI00188D0252|nr:hypothetical protein [Herbiconiux sp. VKM Ac-1786]MBF4572419.1 hypothetical protein [Herbiconiux sp. VKM Ac-1786]
MPHPVLHAWIDESMRTVGVPRPSYLLGGLLTDPTLCDPYRAELTRLRTTGVKLHWRDLDSRHRRRAVEVLAGFRAEFMVVVAAPMDLRKQERARAICLERLAWELQQRGVARAFLEARSTRLMRKDDQTIEYLRGRRSIEPGIRIEHRLPSAEPMLWAADIALGVVGEQLAGDRRMVDSLDGLSDRVSIVQIDL